MSSNETGIRKFALLLLAFFIIPGLPLYAQDSAASDTILIPGPDPFSLDAGSAIYCINLLKNNRFAEKKDKYKIVDVKTVWSRFLEYDESYPEGHRKRYDIIVNGTPLDWDNSFIEYGDRMVNLRLLFLYRNQHPPEDLEYYSLN